jgi:hypothetical protein
MAALVVAAARSSAIAYGILLGCLVAGVVGVYVTASQLAWDVFSVSPVGALTLAARDVVGSRAGVATHVPLVFGGVLGWTLVLLTVVNSRHRRLLPRRPAR